MTDRMQTPRRWPVLVAMGVLGCASLAFLPIEVMSGIPAGMTPAMVRMLAIVQPILLMLVAVLIGTLAAPRVGLGTPLIDALLTGDRSAAHATLSRQAMAALPVIGLVAAILVAFALWTRSLIPGARFGGGLPIVTRVLYGGVVEELLLRWGMMSAILWVVWRMSGRALPVAAWAAWSAILVAAGLFALGHLPAFLAIFGDPRPMAIAGMLLGNFVPGLCFGYLFWRHGLEAAILAHGGAHIVAAIVLAVLGVVA